MKGRVATALLLLAATACRPQGVTLVSETELPDEVYGSPQPSLSPTPPELPSEANVFVVRDGRLHSQTAPLQPVAGSIQEALWVALIGARLGRGESTEIPPDTVLNAVDVVREVVTVDLSAAFEQPGTAQSFDLRIAQVVFTMTQEQSGVTAVRFEIDGEPQPVVQPDRPVSRGDYREFAPQESR